MAHALHDEAHPGAAQAIRGGLGDSARLFGSIAGSEPLDGDAVHAGGTAPSGDEGDQPRDHPVDSKNNGSDEFHVR